MLKKSILLGYLLEYAEVLRKNDGKQVLSANYFILSTLRTIDESDNDKILDTAEAKAELNAVNAWLAKYNINRNYVVESISAYVQSSDYRPERDELLFEMVYHSLVKKVKAEGLESVDTIMYLEMIFAEPTDAIDRYILTQGSGNANSVSGNDIKSIFDSLNPNANQQASRQDSNGILGGDQTENCREGNAAATSSKPNSLSEIIRKTRNIQSFLLDNIYGQDQAVNTFVSGYFQSQLMASARKEESKPQATFLFAGPPGVGKTFLAEKAAEALALPYMRFDMSEYSSYEASVEFCGSDNVYKNGKEGNVTSFVAKNPQCVLLFDEIEKANLSIIYLFLQILDAGRIRDNFSDKEVSFSNAIIIFTTNVGKNLYDDPSVINLSTLPRKKILKALSTDINPATNAPLFPAAICSRFASGNVLMFNHLEANSLYTIAKRELDKNAKRYEEANGIKICIDDKIPSAIMLAEGGKADARTVKGRANTFFHDELYELLRLLASGKNVDAVDKLTQINFTVPLDSIEGDIARMFESSEIPEVLIFAEGEMAENCKKALEGKVSCYFANDVNEAKEILFNHDINVALCDMNCGIKELNTNVLNAEDIRSAGHDFLNYVLERYSLPVYILQSNDDDISQEEFLSFAKLGVRSILTVTGNTFAEKVVDKCKEAYQQENMLRLARENKALSYKTSQTLFDSGKIANINLFDFKLELVTDIDDSKNVLDNVSRPDLHFDDVIGAEDAKSELKYFVEYLKNPVKYMRQGVRTPKGILLYGPPGTGKTLLAKAMAGESGVTFLRAEGNEFLKHYVGDGPESVHSLFNAARKYAPAIIFIDEIDAIGKNRADISDDSSTGDILTAFLTEMDGFNTDTSRPVFVLAATNYGVDSSKGKTLDPALLRRFDRRIYIDLPNRDERKKYLIMKLSKYQSICLSDEEIDNIAMRSTGMSLAELESVIEMALRSAIRSESGVVGDAEFEDAFETFNSGEKRNWNIDTLKRVARHEAGHALLCWMSGEKPSYLTVVARGDHGGYMQHGDHEDKMIYTKDELLSNIRTSLAGRAAEIVYYGTKDGVSTGASGDIYSATKTAERMICLYGMDDDIGMSYVDFDSLNDSQSQLVRERVNLILAEELVDAIRIIETNKLAMDTIVDVLLEKNHLKENEIDEIFTKTVVR